MFVAPIAGALSDRIGGRPLMATGLALQAIGLGWIASVSTATVGYASLVGPVHPLRRSGWRCSSPRSRTSSSRPSGRQEEGKASGANNAIREVGGVLGVAVLASIFARYGGYESPQTFVDGLVPALWVGAAVLGAGVARLAPDPAQAAVGGGSGRRARRRARPEARGGVVPQLRWGRTRRSPTPANPVGTVAA